METRSRTPEERLGLMLGAFIAGDYAEVKRLSGEAAANARQIEIETPREVCGACGHGQRTGLPFCELCGDGNYLEAVK